MSTPSPAPVAVRALVLTGFGINCEEETAAAFRLAGAEASIHHVNELFAETVDLHAFDLLAFPGGFSFGDDLGSGKVLANKLRYKRTVSGRRFFDELRRFLSDGKHVVGFCNGFQALVKLGLLPNVNGRFEQEATLARNDSGRFEDRWCELTVNAKTSSPFLTALTRFRVPVRHGEGKLVLADEGIRAAVVEKGLNALIYCDENGNPTNRYPLNPNGAELSCAGLVDPSGQVLGMMPHPEANLSAYNDPAWPERRRAGLLKSDAGEGLALFVNIVRHIRARAGTQAQGESR